MSSTDQRVQVYQLRIWIRGISPQIWRRLLVRSDSTIAELHDTLQIAFGWMDDHLHTRSLHTGEECAGNCSRVGDLTHDGAQIPHAPGSGDPETASASALQA